MRIEILVDNEDPKIFPLNKPRMLLGSDESCDIILPLTNISRKHLLIVSEGDAFYIIDQGSTNGTYVNEERLVPGKKTEFTSFFPVRLSGHILMSLLSDADAKELGGDASSSSLKSLLDEQQARKQEVTKMIATSELKKSNTAALVQKREKKLGERKTTARSHHGKTVSKDSQEKRKIRNLGIICVLVVAAVTVFNVIQVQPEIAEVIVPQVEEKVVVPEAPIKLVDAADIPTVASLDALKLNPKCQTGMEKYICVSIPGANQGIWGAIEDGKIMHMLSEGPALVEEAREFVKSPKPFEGTITESETKLYNDHLNYVALLLWVQKNVPENLKDLNEIKDRPLSLGLFKSEKQGYEFIVAAVFVPESLIRLRAALTPAVFASAKEKGVDPLLFGESYFKIITKEI